MRVGIVVGVAALIFFLDVITPLGVAGGVLYIILILLAYPLENKRAIPVTAGLGSALTICGFFLSPDGGELWKVLTNRFLALFAIWVVAIGCMLNKRRADEVHILQEAINQSPNPVAITDKDAVIEYVNPAFLQKTGYSKGEVLGKNPRILKSGKHSRDFYQELWDTINSGRTWSGNIFNQRKDGTLYWECLQISPLKNVKGEISHFFSLRLLDKQRELAEKDIDKLTHTLDQIPQGVLMTDRDGLIVYANPTFESFSGYSINEIIGMNPNLLKSKSQTPEFYAKLWQTIVTGNSWRGEIKNKKKNGEFYWERVVISPVHNNGDQISHFIALRDDITVEREKEVRLHTVQKQLLTSEKLAGIGQLAAGVSHEVLNPLNIISIHNQLLKKKNDENPDIQAFTDKLDHEIKRIQKILSSLLVFSRSAPKAYGRGTLRDVVEEVLTLVEYEYKLDKVDILRRWCERPIELLLDKDKIRQVAINLLHNAKYSMPKGGTITVGCKSIEENRKALCQFTFSDTGFGMSEETRLKVFDPFYTTKPEGEGTGMGLSVVHGIIEDHGGKVSIESEEGKGTTVVINLPVAD